jgi:hypothetical protein
MTCQLNAQLKAAHPWYCRRAGRAATAIAIAAGLASAAVVSKAHAQDEQETPFDEAEIFFELNNTDGDLGIHALIDGEPWRTLEIENPDERQILQVRVSREAAKQGLTEIFFESAEPDFEELPPEDYFARFAEGTYEVSARTIDRKELESETRITHLMPAPPSNVQVNGQAAPLDCSIETPPAVTTPVIITWDPVTTSHPDLGRLPPEPIEVVNYEVVVEIDETPFRTSTILPPSATSFQVPEEILALGDEVKFEVLVREQSFNQTAIESCFSS